MAPFALVFTQSAHWIRNYNLMILMEKVAIYGFDRIGRQCLKVALQKELFVPAALADVKDEEILAALFVMDTIYGRWSGPVKGSAGTLPLGNVPFPT